MKRKTISILALIETVNRKNRESTCSPDVRNGWNDLLEIVLYDANVYRGFNYLTEGSVPPGHKPGVILDPTGGCDHIFPDESRRYYHTHESLTSAKRS